MGIDPADAAWHLTYTQGLSKVPAYRPKPNKRRDVRKQKPPRLKAKKVP